MYSNFTKDNKNSKEGYKKDNKSFNKDNNLDEKVEKLIEEREEARKNKDFKRADEIRIEQFHFHGVGIVNLLHQHEYQLSLLKVF